MEHRSPLAWKQLFESSDFRDEYTYDGPLGADYTAERTILRLWAPTAAAVLVRLYRNGNDGGLLDAGPMRQTDKGVWECTLNGDCAGLYYTYVVTANGATQETTDPYARAVGANGVRGMILSPEMAAPAGWEQDERPFIPDSRRAIWEVNIRDFSGDSSCGVNPAYSGRFLGMAQTGTTLYGDGEHPTGLDYLKHLGISYVQILPMYDFGSIDEERSSANRYNWGYDPVNYNAPEGSYSTDPYHGEVRVRELKQMIAALHSAGIGVIMDVVYNHMWKWVNPLNATAPYYFFRQNADGKPSNGSGCGNEVASERPMARRFILDSLRYWAEEYHLDGFRFDLMGLLDVETINAARKMLDSLPGGERILMYGEPWQGGASALRQPGCGKNEIGLLSDRVGVFSDGTRDSIKGSCFEADKPGYVEGSWDSMWDVGASCAAWCRSTAFEPRAAGQVISYVSAHDNYTLWDKLRLVEEKKPDFNVRDEIAVAENRLAAGIYLTSLGIPFMQAGEEFARTKWGEHNSYNSPLRVNRLQWERTVEYGDLVEFYRGLLALRARFPRLSDPTRAAADEMDFLSTELPIVAWLLEAVPGDGAEWSALCAYYNPLDCEREVILPAGRWKLLCDGEDSFLWQQEQYPVQFELTLKPRSATILGRLY